MQHREQAALEDIDATRITRPTAWFLVLAFLALIGVVPLLQIGRDLRAGQRPIVAEAPALVRHGLPKVAELKAFEERLENRDFLREHLLGPSQALLLRLGAGNERCWVGRDGWLFYRDALEHLSGPSFLDPQRMRLRAQTKAVAPDSIAAIVDFREQLGRRGIDLLVVPIPVKAALYPDRLSARFPAQAAPLVHPDSARWRQRLAGAGVPVFDPLPVLAAVRARQPAYLRTDTHWTPAAVEAVAAALRPHLGQPRQTIAWGQVDRPVTQLGDLAQMLRLPDGQDQLLPERVVARQVLAPDGRLFQPDPAAEILVLGDSFCNIYSMPALGWGESAGLVEQLALAFGGAIDRIAVNDGGAYSSRAALARELAGGSDRLAGKRLVIWAFSERELSHGDWRQIALPAVAPRTDAPRPSARQLRARIVAAAPAPQPGSVPYADGIIALVLESQASQRLLAYTWGLRGHRATEAAAWQVGDVLDFDLQPWADQAQALAGYQRSELADPAVLRLPAYWVHSAKPVTRSATAPPTPVATSAPPAPAPRPARSPFAAAVDGLSRREGCAAVEGKQGWCFFLPELRHLASGPYWGADAAASLPALAPELADPRAAILDFKRQLDQLGIPLILVPVPAKATIYPQQLPFAAAPGQQDRAFLAQLRRDGVEVLDLESLFTAHREEADLYLRTDTHWSPAGIALAAEALAARVAAFAPAQANPDLVVSEPTLDLRGDLACARDNATESVTLTRVVVGSGRRAKPLAPDRSSPVLLMGDSHTLVFHAGEDLFATAAGLPDQLALRLGYAVDLLGVRGSGATTVRMDLMRRGDHCQGKKVVIWVFTVRELTQSDQGWAKLAL